MSESCLCSYCSKTSSHAYRDHTLSFVHSGNHNDACHMEEKEKVPSDTFSKLLTVRNLFLNTN